MNLSQMPAYETSCAATDELQAVAENLLRVAGAYKVWIFRGEMGSGKTTLIKEICRQLGVTDTVSSPTFTILNEYHASGAVPVYHFDFYRLKTESEAFDFGYEEYFYSGHYCFIEWPEKIPSLIPDQAVEVVLEILPEGRKYAVFRPSGD